MSSATRVDDSIDTAAGPRDETVSSRATGPTIDVVTACDADRGTWNDFVDRSSDAQAYHDYEWRGVLERTFGLRCHYLMALDGNRDVCGLLPLVHLESRLFGSFLVSLPYLNYAGLLADAGATRSRLAAEAWSLAQTLGASHVELRHRHSVALDLPFRDDKIAMQLSLPGSEEALWQRFSSKLRAQIRRPGKEGATCVAGGIELIEDFYRVFSRNMRDLGTPVFPRRLFAEILETFPDVTRLFVVHLNGAPVASGLTVGFRNRLEIPFASSLREFNRFSVNMLLYWTVIRFAITEGYETFDFGRSTADSGPYRFKKQWGAEPSPLHWHYCLPSGAELPKLNPDNPKFRLAVRVWRRLPLPVANWLGPSIVRHLP